MFQGNQFRAGARYATLIALVSLFFLGGLVPSSLTTVFAWGTPPAPNPISPTYGAIITPDEYPPVGIPEVAWEPVEGTINYRVQFSNNIAFTTVALQITTPNTTYTPITQSPFPDGVYYWRVRVDSPIASDYSNPMEFTKDWATDTNYPILIAPADGATLEFYEFDHTDSNRASFIWEPVIGAAKYRIEIDNSPDFSSLTLQATTYVTTYQPKDKLANGTYYWRVIPLDGVDRNGTPSEGRTFYAQYEQIPILLDPLNGSFPTFTPTFRWTAVVGAQFYRLQYSTDPSFNTATTTINTRNTTYTPTSTLPNDVNYYWRVRAISGVSESDWSAVYQFLKRWYIQPVPLVPTNNYQHAKMGPTFYWTPVPAAAKYKVEIDTNPDFINLFTSGETANTFFTPIVWSTVNNPTYYWRVIPIDGSGKLGQPSEVFSLVVDNDISFNPPTTAPELVYPLYYYDPQVEDPNNPGQYIVFNPAEDRTVGFPFFIWHRSLDPSTGGTFANAYRIQVDNDPNFNSIDWDYDTQNLHASPTSADLFNFVPGEIYYWRVAPITGIAGTIAGDWSQTWKTRFDSSLMLEPTVGGGPQLIHPVDGEEQVEYTPHLDWWPYENTSGQPASEYEVQVSWDEAFIDLETTANVPNPSYSPQLSIAERHLNKNEYGTLYWRVRAIVNGSPTAWSDIWRFQIAAQSLWLRNRAVQDSLDFKIGSDPNDQADDNYELTNIYATQSLNNWFFAFDATKNDTNMTYAIYIDLDYTDGSGATSDACGFSVTAIESHRPEYILYIYQIGDSFLADNTDLYSWNASTGTWNPLNQSLTDVGGLINYVNNTTVEVIMPNTAIGFGPEQGSYNLAVLSFADADPGSGCPAPANPPIDMAPDIAGPTGTVVERFTVVSDRPQLVAPFNNLSGDPTIYPSILPFSIEFPPGYDLTPLMAPGSLFSALEGQSFPGELENAEKNIELIEGLGDSVSPWAGGRLEVYLDPLYTNMVGFNAQMCNGCAFLGWQTVTFGHDIQGDNSYYWRFRTRYYDGSEVFSPWSEGFRFEREGFVPENLQISVDFATPTFSWDIVEGAKTYTLQVDTDPTFSSPDINLDTTQNSYTPITTLDNGTYYWRVRIKREQGTNVTNDWSPSENFTLTLPAVQNLVHYTQQFTSGGVAYRSPTLCWDPLILSDSDDIPVLAAYKYKVQFSPDPNFSVSVTTEDTEQPCFTLTTSHDDGTYYWRVAMIDGNNRLGQYTPNMTLTKQYPITELIAPLKGGIIDATPTFIWTAVDGAATYKLEVSTSLNFATTYETITTPNVRYTPTKTYANAVYYWRVAMIDRNGKIGPFTDAVIIIDPTGYGYKQYMPVVLR